MITNINVGLTANDGLGDKLRNAFIIVNENFDTIDTILSGTGSFTISQVQGLQTALDNIQTQLDYIPGLQSDINSINNTIYTINQTLNSQNSSISDLYDEITNLQNQIFTKIEEAPIDGVTYGRKDGVWVVVNDIATVTTPLQNAIDAINAIIGSSNPDANNIVDTVTEVLSIFQNYPEGSNLLLALANKVDKITGYGLSKNDFTDAYKSKLDNLPYWQTLYQDADRNLINTINVLQKAFSTTAFPNGAFSPPEIGVYEFEWEFAVQDLSAVLGILSVGFLGSATFTVKYHITSQKTSFYSSTAPFNMFSETTGIQNTYTSTTSTQAHGLAKGIIEVTSLGTIIPCFLFNQSATPLVKKGTIFKIAKSKTPISNFN